MSITDLTQIDAINTRLLQDYRVLDGRPIYRIVWSVDQLETRKGIFRDFLGGILLREYEGIKQVPKYEYLKPPCWVLEKLVFIAGHEAMKEVAKELPEAGNGTYEPLYAFRDKDGNPLPVFQRVVDVILFHLHNPIKRTASDVRDQMLLDEEEEAKYFHEILAEGERSDLFVFENSAFVSSNQQDFKRNRNK